MPHTINEYQKELRKKLDKAYKLASEARKKGIDPNPYVECEAATDIADRVERMLGVKVSRRLRELLKSNRKEVASLMLVKEIVEGRFGCFGKREALDLAARIGLAIVTECVTIAPIQGITSITTKRNLDGSEHASVCFAGPIRSAGGTEAAFTLVIVDYARRLLGYDKYRAEEGEILRFIEELRIYERDVGNFQYRVSDEDVKIALRNLPVEIDGIETDPVEVVIHRGLRRIKTDRVRGGALRVLNDGIIGRAGKLLKLTDELSIGRWGWLSELRGGIRENGDATKRTHFSEVISGRPVLSMPSTLGGLRLRYGRAPNTGLACVGLSPILEELLDHPFIAGTQLKTELPGKAATVGLVDVLEPPIVRLEDGSVVKVRSLEEARRLKRRLDKVLFLGDILVSYGDFVENNLPLLPSPYVEEWWAKDLERASKKPAPLEKGRIEELIRNPFRNRPTLEEAVLLSRSLNIPLHPDYYFYFEFLKPEELLRLRDALKWDGSTLKTRLKEGVKESLERAGIEHFISGGELVIKGDGARAIAILLKIGEEVSIDEKLKDALSFIERISGFKLRRKSSYFIGVRVGRPEKASQRKMKPPVHVLFPVGSLRGSSRNLLLAAKLGGVEVEVINRYCERCGKLTISSKCERCGSETKLVLVCPSCHRILNEPICPRCKAEGHYYSTRRIDVRSILQNAVERVGHMPKSLKGVKALTNRLRMPEPLVKGILREKYGLYVYKDGTVRFDTTNSPLTHFRPKDLGTSIEKLKDLGYTEDVEGSPLKKRDQVLELMPQDVILPRSLAPYLVKVAKYVDELLVKVYGMKPYYRPRSPNDLVGRLVMGLAPHTSVGVIGRIIGYAEGQSCFAHPYWHSAKRRDCDGDADSIILLLDVLLNFSRDYLPERIGGLMDSPLLLQPLIKPEELQRQVHNLDVSDYPLEFYESTLSGGLRPGIIELVSNRIKSGRGYMGFKYTHPTSSLVSERTRSSYSSINSIFGKVEKQLELAGLIAAVDQELVASSILRAHLIPDIVGNLRAYTSQSFRCKKCNRKYRRIPVKGVCVYCGGELLPSVSQASVKKYLKMAEYLKERFGFDEYLRERIGLLVNDIKSTFPEGESLQSSLTEFL